MPEANILRQGSLNPIRRLGRWVLARYLSPYLRQSIVYTIPMLEMVNRAEINLNWPPADVSLTPDDVVVYVQRPFSVLSTNASALIFEIMPGDDNGRRNTHFRSSLRDNILCDIPREMSNHRWLFWWAGVKFVEVVVTFKNSSGSTQVNGRVATWGEPASA
jgi:hypothetical protein